MSVNPGKAMRRSELQIFRNFLELPDSNVCLTRVVAHEVLETMVDVVVDERLLGVPDGFLHREELLRDVEAAALLLEHRNDAFEMALGALDALQNFRMRSMCRNHVDIISPRTGYVQPLCAPSVL